MTHSTTMPMFLGAPRGAVKSNRQLRWLRWRAQWGMPLAVAAIPCLVLLAALQLGLLAATSLASAGRPVPALLRDLLTLRPDQVFLVAGLAGAYFVASFLAVRHAVREGFPGSWRLLTETEHVELEDLARLCPAVDAMVDEVCRLGRAPALQDLLQARVLGGSRNVAIAWLSGRATPAPMRRKLVVSPVSGLPASAGGGMAANDAPRHRDIAKVPPRTGSSNSSRVDAKVGTVMPKRGPLATFQIRPGAVGVGGASTPAA